VNKFAFATRVGYLPNNRPKVNQDSFILCPNIHQAIYKQRDATKTMYPYHLFGVCDGHGKHGRDVS
jgi:serine/threonine protein phosphatase PrpC